MRGVKEITKFKWFRCNKWKFRIRFFGVESHWRLDSFHTSLKRDKIYKNKERDWHNKYWAFLQDVYAWSAWSWNYCSIWGGEACVLQVCLVAWSVNGNRDWEIEDVCEWKRSFLFWLCWFFFVWFQLFLNTRLMDLNEFLLRMLFVWIYELVCLLFFVLNIFF